MRHTASSQWHQNLGFEQVTTDQMLAHVNKLLEIPGAKLAFGGRPLDNHNIPQIYGAIEPTAVFVPVKELLKAENFEIVTKEIFGPFQVQCGTCIFL